MSAEEMTVDPAFTYNADLADVSNLHTAMQFIECSQDISYWEAPWRIELPQGGVIRGEGTGTWPLSVGDGGLPANLRIVQLSESGAGKVVVDNSGAVSDALFDMSGTMGSGAAIPEPPEDGVPIGGVMGMGTSMEKDPSDDDSGCAVGGTPGGRSAAAGLWLLAVGAALVLRRRRSR
jgi:MYXO-CTERM domain-containing protein